MAAAAERMEDEALAIDRDIAGRDHRLSGRLRVTSSETLAYRKLTGHLARFRQTHPGIVVELVIDNRVLSLLRREADIALRPMRPKEGDLWGRKLADVAWTVYGAVRYLEERGGAVSSPEDLGGHALIGWEDTAVGIMAADWLNGTVPDDAFVYRTNSLVNQFIAAKAGIGLALLPCYLGDEDSDLVRALPGPVPDLAGELWIVTHADLKRTARVRAFFDIVGEGLAREDSLFSGRGRSRPSV
jgi:DNA-binding transcriptional LysR family regulator